MDLLPPIITKDLHIFIGVCVIFLPVSFILDTQGIMQAGLKPGTSFVFVAVALASRSVALVTLPTQVMMNGARSRLSSTNACKDPSSS